MTDNGLPVRWLNSFVLDLRFAARGLLKSRAFTAVAALALALGIGVPSAMFSLVNATLFRPLSADRPEELVEVVAGNLDEQAMSGQSYPNYLDFRALSADVVSGLATYLPYSGDIVVGAGSERASLGLVSENYFPVLGIQPMVGRVFSPEENTTPGAHFVAVISESLWRRQFEGARDLRGQHLWINGARYDVVGVVPERAARLLNIVKVDAFVPAVMQGPVRGSSEWALRRGNREFMVIGRLKPDVTLAMAKQRFAAIGEQLQRQFPNEWVRRSGPIPLTVVPAAAIGFELRYMGFSAAALLLAAAVCVLLIVCANVANLMLVRSDTRRSEVAARMALGATRHRLVQWLLAEALILSAVGAAGSIVIVLWIGRLLNAFVPRFGLPLVLDLSVDARVVGFNALVIVATTVAFGFAPALQATRFDRIGGAMALRSGPTIAPGRSRLRSTLLIAQVALSLALLMCGGMFLGSLQHIQRVDLGFKPGKVAIMSATVRGTRGPLVVNQVLERLSSLPEVEVVSAAAYVPIGRDRRRIEILQSGGQPSDGVPYAGFNFVAESYFSAVSIPLLRGRPFDRRDAAGAPVAIVNETFARRMWPNANAVGQRFSTSESTVEVIGVVRDSKYEDLAERPLPFIYLPIAQHGRSTITFYARTSGDPAATLPAIQRAVVEIDPTIAVFDLKTMDEHIAASALPVEMGATLLGLFGLVALGLACLGLFGVISHTVSQRTRELGVRLAVGATPGVIRMMVFRQTLTLTFAGVAIGLVMGAAASAAIATQLYGLSPADVWLLAAVVLAQVGVVLVASWLPARRATRIDPIVALGRD